MRNRPLAPYAYLFPGILLLTVFIILPVFFLLVLSFFKWDVFSGQFSYLKFQNYLTLVKDPGFYSALLNTFVYVTGTVLPSMAAALFIAVCLNQKIKGTAFYRSSIFLPVIVSLAATGIIWLWIYDYQSGMLNHLLSIMGLGKIDWLGNPDLALFSVIAVTVWKRIGYNMVIFFAGLQMIPSHLYEAAKVDGARPLNQFRYVTWPNLLPVTSFVLVINLIFSFRDFAQIYTMTRGGPIGRTTTLVYYIYETAFKEFNVGYAAALSMVLFVIVMLFTYIKVTYMSEAEKE